jgi:hypothetical protein
MKPQASWTGIWQGWLGRWTQPEARRMQAEERSLRQQMEAARQEMKATESYFQTVTDPELIDHAIFAMEAAKRKYLYFYRRLRRVRGSSAVETVQEAETAEWM